MVWVWVLILSISWTASYYAQAAELAIKLSPDQELTPAESKFLERASFSPTEFPARRLSIQRDVVDSGRNIAVDLGEGEVSLVRRKTLGSEPAGSGIWGGAAGQASDFAVIVGQGGRFGGVLNIVGEFYQILYFQDNVHIAVNVSRRDKKNPILSPFFQSDVVTWVPELSRKSDVKDFASGGSHIPLTAIPDIRILSVHSPESLSIFDPTIQSNLAIALVNESFRRSSVVAHVSAATETSFELENFVETACEKNAPGCATKMLTEIRSNEAVQKLRDAHSADIVIFLVSRMDRCGESAGLGVSADNSYSIIDIRCVARAGQFTLAHEIGHLLGAGHEYGGTVSPLPGYEYGHGYLSGTHKSIMAVGAPDVLRRLEWSRPPDFGSEHENVAKLLNERATVAAVFRH
jgi:hypothetical protein